MARVAKIAGGEVVEKQEEEDFSAPPPPLCHQLLQHPRQQHRCTAATIAIVLQKQVSALHSLASALNVWLPLEEL